MSSLKEKPKSLVDSFRVQPDLAPRSGSNPSKFVFPLVRRKSLPGDESKDVIDYQSSSHKIFLADVDGVLRFHCAKCGMWDDYGDHVHSDDECEVAAVMLL